MKPGRAIVAFDGLRDKLDRQNDESNGQRSDPSRARPGASSRKHTYYKKGYRSDDGSVSEVGVRMVESAQGFVEGECGGKHRLSEDREDDEQPHTTKSPIA